MKGLLPKYEAQLQKQTTGQTRAGTIYIYKIGGLEKGKIL